IMITEIAVGRSTGTSVVTAFARLNRKYTFIGYLSLLVPLIILPYYSVIGGWVMKYAAVYFTGGADAAATDGFFGGFIALPLEPILWTLIFVALACIVVLFGVEKGIERANKILMPTLILMLIGLTAYCLSLPGGLDGLWYYIYPDFSEFSAETVLAAMGQVFYSLTLGFGVMITYGSYLEKKTDLERSVRTIEIFDTGVAFLAGLLIIPAVFVFSGGSPEALGAGPGLMFQALPKVFDMMPFGSIVAAFFFVLVAVAALTSCICMLEVPVAVLGDRFGVSRKTALGLVFLFTMALVVPISLGFSVLDWISLAGMSLLDMFDFFSNSILLPIVALLTCIFIGWIVKPKMVIDEVKRSSPFRAERMYEVMVKFIAPICIAAILIYGLLSVL
ncbi:MAG: sodium-dependent transporter, partial [Methanocorpusculum sp.]|nr:sodium-dependent transporter [Methanocorpusculum sp.]